MWVRLDDAIPHHPKFARAGPEVFALFVAGLCYCNRYQTDGLIPKLAVPHLLPGLAEGRAMELAMNLTTNAPRPSWGDEGDHFRVHDYEHYQPTRDDAQERRAQNADRQRRFRERHAAAGDAASATVDPAGGVTRYVVRDRNARNAAVTRPRNAAQRYGNAPLPGPLPPTRPVPGRRDLFPGPGLEHEQREGLRRAQNAERQRRFRERHRASGGGAGRPVTRDHNAAIARDVTPVTRDSNAAAVTPDRYVTRDGYAADVTPDGNATDLTRAGDASLPAALPAPGRDRDLRAEFDDWFAAYPRQEAELPARQAWMAAPDLPPLALLLERLASQGAARPDATFWPAPDRYLRERRWGDRPPPAARTRQARSPESERRALGSDDARRRRLSEISAEAWFDPEAPDA